MCSLADILLSRGTSDFSTMQIYGVINFSLGLIQAWEEVLRTLPLFSPLLLSGFVALFIVIVMLKIGEK
jgi:hypothetical protein